MTETGAATAHTGARREAWVVLVAFVGATLLRGVGEFRYDALYYWLASQDVVGSIPAAPDDFWPLRGVLTAIVYAPSAALSAILGENFAGFSVLLQNALLLGWLAAFLLPRLLRDWCDVSTRTRWVGAGLTWLVVAGFAPFPLVDVYAAVACFLIIDLLQRDKRIAVLAAGLVGGVAINLRPAYLVAVLLLALVALVWKRRAGLLMPAGVVLALVPQAVFGAARFGSWSPWPPRSNVLMGLQAGLGSYVVRYDTLVAAPQPQLFYCSPAMAQELDGTLPASMGELAWTFLTHLPTSLIFSLQKIGAALHWPLSTPYTTPTAGLDVMFAMMITGVTVVGIAALIRRATLTPGRRPAGGWSTVTAVAAVLVSAVLTLVSSAVESRFALPLVLLGVLGCTTLSGVAPRTVWARGRWWVVGTAVAAAVVVAVGYSGLSHPAPAGTLSQATCASL